MSDGESALRDPYILHIVGIYKNPQFHFIILKFNMEVKKN